MSTDSIPIKGLCDADWASDPEDRISTSGAAIYFATNLVSWWSKKQQIVARSSTEAEYRSLAQATAEVSWIQTLLTELNVSFPTRIIFCDNESVVSLSHNPLVHSRTMHMEIDVFSVPERVLAKQLLVCHIPAIDQWVDASTKPLAPSRFMFLRQIHCG